jgi:hypothetical protein
VSLAGIVGGVGVGGVGVGVGMDGAVGDTVGVVVGEPPAMIQGR